MTTQNEEAMAICKFFATKCGIEWNTMFIAGSWVANPFRAEDIDIWVYRPRAEIKDEVYRDLGNLIHGATHAEMSASAVLGTNPDSYLEWYGKPVQIIETPFQIFELMDKFDLSCCCYALTHNGVPCTGDKATHPINEEIKVLRETASTAHRLVKLNKRFGHSLRHKWSDCDLLEIPF